MILYQKFCPDILIRKVYWRSKWQTTQVFLPGISHGQRSLVGYTVLGVTVSDTTEPLSMYTLIRKVGFGMVMYVMKFFSLELLSFRKMTQIHTTAFFAVTNPSRSA